MMNLELLLKANELTNGQSPVNFVGIVANHSTNTILNHFRADATTFHAVAYNDTNGAIVRRYNVQGFGDDSVWSRGLAWGIHGLTTVHDMMPEGESDSIYLETAEKAAGWFISRLPDDYIPYYDFSVPLGAQYVPRDTSAAAIAAHAFLKLFNITSNSMYFETAEKIMESLISDKYRADGKPEYNIPAILVNGTVFYNQGDFDTSIVYADFYFLRALDLYINITSSRK
jgi:unsaturated chondroitin disaccharide hydrolase